MQPAAILSTVLSVWGGGKLRPPFAAGPLALAKHDELVARAWEAVVRPIALHLFSTCWDGMLAFPGIKETVQALIWVDAHVCAAAEFPREPSKLTLLHVVAAVPCLLLLVTLGVPMQSKDGAQQHTSFVIEAMQAMPRFRAWMRAAYAMLGARTWRPFRSAARSTGTTGRTWRARSWAHFSWREPASGRQGWPV